jgi:predicted RNA binding protein YcfA (HicA-like mRNA interferase family)
VTPKLPTATAKDLVRVAERLGFVFRRQRGISHGDNDRYPPIW